MGYEEREKEGTTQDILTCQGKVGMITTRQGSGLRVVTINTVALTLPAWALQQ